MKKEDIKKIVLAYSGGLDTSVIICWLKENYPGCELIAVAANLGQQEEFDGLKEKALKTGASKCYVLNLVEEYADEYILPCLKAGASYEGYLLGTANARPLIAKHLVKIALAEGADAIAHGCTGKGNDQVRFELAIRRFAPNMHIIAPWRQWELKSREDEIAYAEAHGIELKISSETNYSKDMNIWHLSHEGLDLENPANEAKIGQDGFLEMSVSPIKAPDEPELISIEFERGVPTALNGEALSLTDIILKLNAVGGKHGVGLLDLVENRLVGIKSRGVYETPAGTVLYEAHKILESLTLDRDSKHEKDRVALLYGELVYNGFWFSRLRKALDAFVEVTQERVSGKVNLRLYKGNILNAGAESPYSIYNEELASFGESEYEHRDAAGFINLYGMQSRVEACMLAAAGEGD